MTIILGTSTLGFTTFTDDDPNNCGFVINESIFPVGCLGYKPRETCGFTMGLSAMSYSVFGRKPVYEIEVDIQVEPGIVDSNIMIGTTALGVFVPAELALPVQLDMEVLQNG